MVTKNIEWNSKSKDEDKTRNKEIAVGGLCLRKFSDSFCAFGNCMFCQLPGKNKADSRLDFARSQCAFLVISNESAGVIYDSVECVLNQRVHDAHGPLADSHLGVYLLQNPHDV